MKIVCLVFLLFFSIKTMAIGVPINLVYKGRVLGVVKFYPESENPKFDVNDVGEALMTAMSKEQAQVFKDKAKVNSLLSLPELNKLGAQFEFDEDLLIMSVVFNAVNAQTNIVDFKSSREQTNVYDVVPEEFSGYLNTFNQIQDSPDSTEVSSKFRLVNNYKNWVLINEASYYYRESNFNRDKSFLFKDDIKNKIRYHLGEINSSSRGSQLSYSMRGIGFNRENSIFPLDTLHHGVSQQIILETPSTVSVLINGKVVDKFFSREGPLNLRNIPLAQGANNVELLVEDSYGQKKSHHFSMLFDSSLLIKGERDFSFFLGAEEFSHKAILSAYYSYGLSNTLTSSLYANISRNSMFLGTQHNTLFKVGTVGLDFSQSLMPKQSLVGAAVKLFYEVPDQWEKYLLDSSLRLSSEWTQKNYQTEILQEKTPKIQQHKLKYSQSLSRDFGENVNIALSAFQAIHRYDPSFNIKYYSWNTSYRISNNWNTSLSVQHQNNESKSESKFSISLRWNEGLYRSSVTQNNNDNTQFNISRESANPYEGLDVDANLENNPGFRRFGFGLGYNSPYFESSARHDTGYTKKNLTKDNYATYNFATSLVWANQNFALSSPINNSFLIIKKKQESLSNNPIFVNQSLEGSEATLGDHLPVVISRIAPYSKRSLLLTQENFEIGSRLEPQSFDIGAMNFQGAVLEVAQTRNIFVKGRLMQSNSKPWNLKRAEVTGPKDKKEFFTNRGGYFFLEEVQEGTYRIDLNEDGVPKVITFKVPAEQTGLFNVGDLLIPE